MKYTIDDLRGKYVKVGTPKCEIFIHACDTLGIRWASGESARNKHQDKECIALSHHSEFLSFSDLSYYQHTNGWDLFVPKTDAATQHIDWRKASERAQPFIDDVINHTHGVTQRTVESSAVKNLESSPDTMTIGEMVDSGQSVFGGRITQCDDVDNTVTQRGERYGLFADGAVIMQNLKAVMRATPGWERLTTSQREALEMIQHKIGRVLNGDPTYDDNWRDIAGYATLILNELNGVKRQ